MTEATTAVNAGALTAAPRRVIPIVRAETLIPRGPYCYTVTGELRADGGYSIKRCSFWRRRADWPAQADGYCDYLRRGDNDPEGTLLLFDQVKECGVHDDDEDDLLAGPFQASSPAAP